MTTADLIREGWRLRGQLSEMPCPCRECEYRLALVEELLGQLEQMETRVLS